MPREWGDQQQYQERRGNVDSSGRKLERQARLQHHPRQRPTLWRGRAGTCRRDKQGRTPGPDPPSGWVTSPGTILGSGTSGSEPGPLAPLLWHSPFSRHLSGVPPGQLREEGTPAGCRGGQLHLRDSKFTRPPWARPPSCPTLSPRRLTSVAHIAPSLTFQESRSLGDLARVFFKP